MRPTFDRLSHARLPQAAAPTSIQPYFVNGNNAILKTMQALHWLHSPVVCNDPTQAAGGTPAFLTWILPPS
jgi:hypothetical protein